MLRAIAIGLAGIVTAIVGLELLFMALPVSTSTGTGYFRDDAIVTYPPRHAFTVATGWSLENVHRHRSNNQGFLAYTDFEPDASAIGLIGDSYVDASMIADEARLDARLTSLLNGRKVYALGSAGSSLLDYAARINYAQRELGLREYVIVIEVGDVMQSRCGSGNNQGPCLDPKSGELVMWQASSPGPWKKLLRHSALAQYFVSQLKITPASPRLLLDGSRPPEVDSGSVGGRPAPRRSVPGEVSPDFAKRAVAAFFELSQSVPASNFLFVVDCDRIGLEKGGNCATPTRTRFIELALARGARVLDLAPMFVERWRSTGLSLAVSPRDGHWNRATVALVAQQIAAAMTQP